MRITGSSTDIGIHLEHGDKGYALVSHGYEGDMDYGTLYISFPKDVAQDIAKKILELTGITISVTPVEAK